MTGVTLSWAPERQAWLQGVFDTGARGLIAQGKKSLSIGGNCCYRGEEGSKCALGFSIPDKEYKDSWDKSGGTVPYVKPSSGLPKSIQASSIAIAKALGCLNEREATALRDLQMCHDNARDASEFVQDVKGRLQHFAMKYNLNPDVLEESA
jgi:hypothetical protein